MSLLPEEQAFVDAFWSAGWTLPQAERALANLLDWKCRQVRGEVADLLRKWSEDPVLAHADAADTLRDAADAIARIDVVVPNQGTPTETKR